MESTADAVSSDRIYSEYGAGSTDRWPTSVYEISNKTQAIYARVDKSFGKVYVGAGAMYQVSNQTLEVHNWHCATRGGSCVEDYTNAIPSEYGKDLRYETKHTSIKPFYVIGYEVNDTFSVEYGVTKIGKRGGDFPDFVDMNKGSYHWLMVNVKW